MTARIRTLCYLLLAAAFIPLTARAQIDTGTPPDHNLEAFETLDFRAPNEYRAAAGRPGNEYWQQEADYRIRVQLDPATHTITGTETITYTNNAPQALHQLWVQLDQNLFKPGSRGARITDPQARFSGAFEGGGYTITEVMVAQGGEAFSPDYVIDDTRMRIPLSEPLPANGGQLRLTIGFRFQIPDYGADRMGRLDVKQGTVYQIAQWYPRMFVYDDVNGWNPLPYLGQGEYYLEYGTFEVDITVPRDYIVAATGRLLNPSQVLTPEQQRRLEQARQSQETVAIISRSEVGAPSTRPDGEGPLTWKYRADDVRDFSWAASNAFIWDAAHIDAGGNDVLGMSFYPQEGIGTEQNPGWERSTQYVQHSIHFYSETYAPYPYPVAINVAGIVGGMEYPQIVFCSVEARGRGLFGVTDHELGHEWFPMMVGSDERRHVWMDEGLNTFINFYSARAFYGTSLQAGLQQYAQRIAGIMESPLATQPITTYADRIRGELLGFLGYRKPAAGLLLLREYIIGPERFDPAFQAYIDRWTYKHPQPADFFRTMEDVAGEDLDWFWRGWFYETDQLDQAVEGVALSSDSTQTLITVANRAGLMMPVQLQVTFADGTTAQRRVPVEAFHTSDTFAVAVPAERTVQQVQIDPRGILPDVNRTNNTWTRAASPEAEGPSGNTPGGTP